MQYRVVRKLTYNRSGTVVEPIYIDVGTLLTTVPLDDLLPWDRKGIKGQLEQAAADDEKLIIFQYEGVPRTARVGRDVTGVKENYMAKWRKR